MKINFEKITAAVFILVIASCSGYNAFRNKGKLSESLEGIDLDNARTTFAAAAESFKTNFAGRSKLIDMYGAALKLLGKDVVGSFEFIKDKNGNMQNITDNYDYDTFYDSMSELKTAVGNTELFFVNLPEAANYDAVPIADHYSFQNSDRSEICTRLSQSGIDVLDINSYASADSFYFKTDVHPKTESEFITAKAVYEYLLSENVPVSGGEIVFDKNNYTVEQRDFVGNLSRSSGKYYAGIDTFEYYIPDFYTDLELLVYDSCLYRSGSWSDVILNHKFPQDNIYNYYVTDYMQWPSPVYTIKNNSAESTAKILYIADSMALRTISYLSLCANEITVADTRYSTDLEYVKTLLANNSYDAVIVSAASPVFINTPFNSYFSTEELDGISPTHLPVSDEWIARGGIWTDGQKSEVYLPLSGLKKYMGMYRITGWAVDFNSNTPVTDVIAEVNGKKYLCSYGYDKKGVPEKFGIDGLLRSGYALWIPESEISVGDTISFTMINSNTQTVYEPVTYEFTE